ncbi:MAG TPA: heparan-alpha-glucosaminide N-acetyltransferase domain-containing protein [Gemmatimonadaceae bacterium]|nr:heparan-alpha-glucosaminide N-acetyltransferase domain-containing protein [Gemmatimonadaceae bacterium]
MSAPAITYPPRTPVAPYTPLARTRVDSVDLLRGLIMVIMMLDHTRDFVHFQATMFDPTNVARTTPILFFTRWITHFCAPLFVFLAGTGAYFQSLRGKPRKDLSVFLVTRGLWLIFLELTVVRVLVFFNVDLFEFLFLQVIWAIGCSMIVLAGLVYLPVAAIAAFGVAMVALHNLFDGVQVTSWAGPGTTIPGFWASVWHVLHVPGLIFPFGANGPKVFALYPLIPWIGVMAAGYAFGSVYRLEPKTRKRFLVRTGLLLTAAFIVIRAINIYGDPARWAVQDTPMKTFLSFLATSKYPPSLLFLLMTIGPALLFLAWVERSDSPSRDAAGENGAAPSRSRLQGMRSFFITYGRVPMFFYLLQWVVAHTLAIVASIIAGKPYDHLFSNIIIAPPAQAGAGFGLVTVYALWILGVLLLYPLCRWYANVKARRRDWWLSYL